MKKNKKIKNAIKDKIHEIITKDFMKRKSFSKLKKKLNDKSLQSEAIENLVEEIMKHESFSNLKKELTNESLQLESEISKTSQATPNKMFENVKREMTREEHLSKPSQAEKPNISKIIEKIKSGEMRDEMTKLILANSSNDRNNLSHSVPVSDFKTFNKNDSEYKEIEEIFGDILSLFKTKNYSEISQDLIIQLSNIATKLSEDLSKIAISTPTQQSFNSKLNVEKNEKMPKKLVKQTRKKLVPKKKTKTVVKKTSKVTAASKTHKKK